MNHILKKVLLTLLFLFMVSIVLWLSLAIYVTTHREKVLGYVIQQLNENISGKLSIERMEPSLIRGFPGISVRLKNVLLRDSLFKKHHHNLIAAKEVFVAVNVFSILKGQPKLQKISIEDGEIYLFTDSSGYRNLSMFRKPSGNKSKSGTDLKILQLKNVMLTIENLQKDKDKMFSFHIGNLSGKFNYDAKGWKAKVDLNVLVKLLQFKSEKGSYIEKKNFQGRLAVKYDTKTEILTVADQEIVLDNSPLNVRGNFKLRSGSENFDLHLEAPGVSYKKALSWLTPAVSLKLNRYSLERPFDVEARISGQLKGPDTPLVTVFWRAKENTLRFKGEKILRCSFSGKFSNEVVKGQPRADPNSVVTFYNFRGAWRGIDFRSDTIRIVNLKRPVFEGRFSSRFPVSKINSLSGSETFLFKNGYMSLDLLYRAPFNRKSAVSPFVFGYIAIKNADLTYTPRDIRFDDVNGQLIFRKQDVYIRKLTLRSSSSQFNMEGSIANFLNLYYTDPRKIVIDWDVNSPQINLVEFLSFLGRRKTRGVVNEGSGVQRVFRQLNRVLDEANVNIRLKANQLNYKRFKATDINAELILQQNAIDLRKVRLQHAGGSFALRGRIGQGRSINPFKLNAEIQNADLRKLFYSFENFGQSALDYQNLLGKLSSQVAVTGRIRENGAIVPGSIYGRINFDLKKGALINFDPMEKVGRFAFPNRNFSNIRFNELKNTLYLQGNKILIKPMLIRSSVLNLKVGGVYGMPRGTNIDIEVPLRNPKKDAGVPDSLIADRMQRGVVIHLSAVDDENGDVKIKLGKSDKETSTREKDRENKSKP